MVVITEGAIHQHAKAYGTKSIKSPKYKITHAHEDVNCTFWIAT